MTTSCSYRSFSTSISPNSTNLACILALARRSHLVVLPSNPEPEHSSHCEEICLRLSPRRRLRPGVLQHQRRTPSEISPEMCREPANQVLRRLRRITAGSRQQSPAKPQAHRFGRSQRRTRIVAQLSSAATAPWPWGQGLHCHHRVGSGVSATLPARAATCHARLLATDREEASFSHGEALICRAGTAGKLSSCTRGLGSQD